MASMTPREILIDAFGQSLGRIDDDNAHYGPMADLVLKLNEDLSNQLGMRAHDIAAFVVAMTEAIDNDDPQWIQHDFRQLGARLTAAVRRQAAWYAEYERHNSKG